MVERKSILVSADTHAWLTQEVQRLVAESERCGGFCSPFLADEPRAGKGPLSMDAMIRILLDARQQHRERRRKSKRARRKASAKRPSAAVMAWDGLAGPPAEGGAR